MPVPVADMQAHLDEVGIMGESGEALGALDMPHFFLCKKIDYCVDVVRRPITHVHDTALCSRQTSDCPLQGRRRRLGN
jgi:hypothetical protein